MVVIGKAAKCGQLFVNKLCNCQILKKHPVQWSAPHEFYPLEMLLTFPSHRNGLTSEDISNLQENKSV
jgi:hypothetical protein